MRRPRHGAIAAGAPAPARCAASSRASASGRSCTGWPGAGPDGVRAQRRRRRRDRGRRGRPARSTRSSARWRPTRRRWPASTSVVGRASPASATPEFVIAASAATAGGAAISRRRRHLRRLPARAVRPGRPAVPLSVHQLHPVRAAVHDRPRRAVRPAEHHDGRLRDVRRLPTRVRPTRPTGASTPSRSPAPVCGPRLDDAAGRGASRCCGGGARAGGEGARRLPPGVRCRRRRGGRAAAGAQAPRRQAVRRDDATAPERARRG